MKTQKLPSMGIILMRLMALFLVTSPACSESSNLDSDELDKNQQIQENLPGVDGYPIVGTNQTSFYGLDTEINMQSVGDDFYGQNANYPGNQPSYVDNGDGTITDMVTGLMWSKSSDLNGDGKINYDDKLTQSEAVSNASSFGLADYDDWRLPSIKELYSLILFSGEDPSGIMGYASDLVPFIDTNYFNYAYGDESAGERIIDSQFATTSLDVGDSNFGGGNLMFGVNFADGRIKGYPTGTNPMKPEGKKFYVFYVRGNEEYGKNDFVDNNDGTITDQATGLMWMKDDSDEGMSWDVALKYAESKEFADYSDWRLPSVKELQSIVDYSRAPGATNSAAIDPLINCTEITNEAGQRDYPYFWSGTTHANHQGHGGGAYVSFGRAMGYFNGQWQDVHGAGAQRSDPKVGDPGDYPYGHGPQGDAIRISNFVRLVRNAK
ncbi:Lcl C-terminal domain-containing protein [Sunxiuqinia sp. A32]|uniref:Lcl C-terminal domain-containing protein n=1 Tax=Sunxiuqinia sp. A32 TaxID=3461496 RepID=UPI00404533E4